MRDGEISVVVRRATKPGNVKAYADLKFVFPGGTLDLIGFSVIEQAGKPPWVGFPAKAGNVPGRFFPIVNADGGLRERICKSVLEAFHKVMS